ncbi:unnamed protein product, partial [Ectocarpus fasciculatus]
VCHVAITFLPRASCTEEEWARQESPLARHVQVTHGIHLRNNCVDYASNPEVLACFVDQYAMFTQQSATEHLSAYTLPHQIPTTRHSTKTPQQRTYGRTIHY